MLVKCSLVYQKLVAEVAGNREELKRVVVRRRHPKKMSTIEKVNRDNKNKIKMYT